MPLPRLRKGWGGKEGEFWVPNGELKQGKFIINRLIKSNGDRGLLKL